MSATDDAAAEAAKQVAIAVYNDGAKGVVQQVGDTASKVARALLRGLAIGADAVNAGWDRLEQRLTGRIESIPPDRRLPAPAVLAPAALHYALLGAGDDTASWSAVPRQS